jgi:membrane protease YdiL (CAAX protease family)
MLLLMLGAVLLAAICEEILFRGIMMQLLARGGYWRSAIFISALLFAVFHLDFIGLLPRTLLGIYFGILVWRSGSIFPAMVAHGANNLLAFALVPFAGDAGPAPTMEQAVLLAGAAGAVFLGMLMVYLRFTQPPDDGRPVAEGRPLAPVDASGGGASEAPAPRDTSTPPDSSHRTDPHES